MDKGVFFSVGVGPGDPELMTQKAVRTIRECGVICAPDSGGKENAALNIAREHLTGKRVELCDMPMTRDKSKLDASHEAAAKKIAAFLDAGQSVAFLTLGDPTVYSTAMYIHARLAAADYETRIIPGVPSFCAAAAAANTALCEGAEPLHIIPASYAHDFTAPDGTTVLMKSGKELARIVSELNGYNGEVIIVQRASMDGERVFRSAREFDGDNGYFTIVLIKSKENTDG